MPDLPVGIVTTPPSLYLNWLRTNVQGDALEAARRRKLAETHVNTHPQGSKVTFNKKVREETRMADYLYGYQQACLDMLQPKDTPGVPATAYTLLNRIGQMVLKNRAEIIKIPLPRSQCPGCFCIMVEDADKQNGWCHNCFPHRERLIGQLHPNGEDNTIPTGPQEEAQDVQKT